jgi:3-oxoacyl-[acyl-carrier protein] reductase
MEYWKNQIVLVTGGTGGIGQSLVRKFLHLGCRVGVNYHSNDAMAEEFKQAIGSSDRLKFIKADVANSADVNRMYQEIETDWGNVTILINNAGLVSDSLMPLITDEDWFAMINTHLTGTFFCCRRSLKGMMTQRFGKILSISSISALRGVKGQTHYSAAKAGMIALTKSLSREVAVKNIHCNSLVLGLIETPKVKKVLSSKQYQEKVESSSLKRVGHPDEVADLVEFLVSEQNRFMTGQAIVADGGLL